jgi:hypothetical protein
MKKEANTNEEAIAIFNKAQKSFDQGFRFVKLTMYDIFLIKEIE